MRIIHIDVSVYGTGTLHASRLKPWLEWKEEYRRFVDVN